MRKRRKKIQRVVINDRDRELFSYLYEVKVATANQLKRDIFHSVTKTVLYRRMKKFVDMKMIKRTPYFDGKRAISTYSLSKEGLRKYIFTKKDEDAFRRCLSDSVEHDVILNDIRNLFMGCSEIEDYFSENVLNSYASFIRAEKFNPFRQMHSDGVVLLKRDDSIFNIAIEYEHTLKYTGRYKTLFYNYQYESEIDAIFYICRDKKVLKRISEAEGKSNHEESSKVYYTTLDELFSNPKELKFISGDKKNYTLIT